MRTAISAACAAAVVLVSGRVAATGDGRIGVYADLTATQTSTTFSIGVARTLYVIAHLEGQSATGITGAELRVEGIPGDWLVFVTPNPAANITLGDPFHSANGVHRGNIAFFGCQQPGPNGVLLYTAIVIPQSFVPPGEIAVLGGDPPTNPNFATPVFTLCDAPEFSKVAAKGEVFQFDVRAPQDLDYSPRPGYDLVRGVQPTQGLAGDLFRFRVVYSNATGLPPQAGSPRLELDANGDGDTDDAGEGAFTMSSADLDSTFDNGKSYRHDVALGEPPGGHYRYRFTAIDHNGMPVVGAATQWRDSLFVGAGLADLEVRAEDIRVDPTHPNTVDKTSIFVPVHNRSDRRLENVLVRVETTFGATIAQRNLAVLGPRATTELACTWRFEDIGFQPLVVRLDPGETIAESDESNNVATHTVFVGGSSVTGSLVISGMPPLVTVPPVAPFGLVGTATYQSGAAPPGTPVRNARVRFGPSWQAAFETRTDDTGAFRVELTPPAVPNGYQLSVVVDDGAATGSAVVNLQVTPLPGQQPPHEPNLAVQLAAVLGTGCPATSATITWTIENRGDRDSQPTTVRLLADGVAIAADRPVPAIAAGGSVSVPDVQVSVTGARLHSFTAIVDPGNTLRELRRDDNFATASVRVPVDCLDLALARMRFNAPRICSDEAVQFSMRVENRGCVGSQAARVACLLGGVEIESAALPAIAPGEFADVGFTHTFGTGCVNLEFALDPEGTAGSDCDDRGDDLTASVCPQPCGPPPPPLFPNFTVLACDLSVSNPRPAPGEAVQFRAWIANTGPGNATAPVNVVFRLDGNILGGQVPGGTLLTGQRVQITAPVTWPVDFAPHTVDVQILTGGQNETTPADNIAGRILPWELRLQPIARCPPSGNPTMFSVCSVCATAPFDVRAVVLNDGLFDCDSVRVDFRTPSSILGSVVTPVLAGSNCGSPAPVAITTSLPTAGNYPISAVVDPANEFPEGDELNNTYTQDMLVNPCIPLPDLVVTSVVVPGPTPAPGDTVTAVEVRVRNQGAALATDVRALLRVGGTTVCANLLVGDIGPDASTTVVCTQPWFMGGDPCAQVLEACADPNAQIAESNETNNCTTAAVGGLCVTDLALFESQIQVTPPNPSVGQQVLIEVGVYSFRRVESTCMLIAEWSPNGVLWSTFAMVPLHIPPDVFFIPAAATFTFVPLIIPSHLRFSLVSVFPPDEQPNNNVALGSLPWFVPPGTPVTVTDLVAESTPDGVRVRWRAEPGATAFMFDRRRDGEVAWQRLPGVIDVPSGSGARDYEFVDRDAEPGVRLEYRLVGRLAEGGETVLGTLTVVHDAAGVATFQLYPVRPHPFRAGGAFEFAVPRSASVDLSVFDAAGRRVIALRRGAQPAGRHLVSWDGRDSTGRRVPAGVYFCRLAAESFEQTRRVVLVR